MDVASTVPFQIVYRVFTGRGNGGAAFGFLNLLRLWRLRRVSSLFARLEKDTRFSYFWTRYVKLICVSELKAEYYPPKVDIILRNEIPTDFYIIVSGAVDVLTYKNGTEQFLTKLGATEMAGEIGVIFNIPQPFTVRSKRLSQVVRISHRHFTQIAQSNIADGQKIISNFLQFLKNLSPEMLNEIPFVKEMLSDMNDECSEATEDIEELDTSIPSHAGDPDAGGTETTISPISDDPPRRVIMHAYHPDEADTQHKLSAKLVFLPESIEELLKLAEKKFGIAATKVLMSDGSEVEELNVLRENDKIFVC